MFAKKHLLADSLPIFLSYLNYLSFCFFSHREPESVSEQSAGLSWSAAGRDQPGGDGGPLCPQTAGDPQGHR